jgi:hypothetical protein
MKFWIFSPQMNLKKITLIIFVAIMMLISISTLFASYVSPKNSTYISGHFRSLRKDVAKGDVSYALSLTESDKSYRISADWAHCFLVESFLDGVKPGQPVQLYLSKSFLRAPMVADLSSNGINYLGIDCVNDSIDENRYKIPLILLGVSIFAIALYASRKVKLR